MTNEWKAHNMTKMSSPLDINQFKVWERRTRIWATTLSAVSFLICLPLALLVIQSGRPAAATFALSLFPPAAVYRWRTGCIRRRRTILSEPFPAEWEAVLQRDVLYFRVLNSTDQSRFRQQIQLFLKEKRVTGIRTQLDPTTLVLTAASAIIPIFGFPDWEWDQINEVLVYPNRFDEDFRFGEQSGQSILGMVGTGSLNRLMILSKPDLIQGFRNAGDKRNVGVHEFAHLVDKTDGSIDGIPGIALDRQSLGPWLDLVRRKMSEIERGRSDIDRYALTNEAEFFAVTSEYFFERPELMQRKHPHLYEMLEEVFNQNWRARASRIKHELTRPKQHFGRNSPCPCGSGQKFKKCCLS